MLISRIREIYSKGENIIQFLREHDNRKHNTIEDIIISYDFQAGSYIEHAQQNAEYIDNYTRALANVINDLGKFSTLLEAGVGEATTRLDERSDHWYSNESLLSYPKIKGIPVLTPYSAILTSKMNE